MVWCRRKARASGFILDKEGHVLTNFHVIQGAENIEVTLHNKRNYPAKVIGTDQSHDLAVIPDQRPSTSSLRRWATRAISALGKKCLPSAVRLDSQVR